ncbi:MAG: metalloregulator ArsR/SmtB family transcription factor [Anaerolineae bacterium]|nr:metalloregulator ArsR/SmtB family transcription factor [Anaerolineae bacterium]
MDTAAKQDTSYPEEGKTVRRPEEHGFSDSGLSSAEIERQAKVFTALGNETRLKILRLLLDCDEMCVSDIVKSVGGAASTVAHHLHTLEDAELILNRRHGRSTYYTVRKEELAKYHTFE